MQYVRSISGSLSSTWNSINPATLSGAIDVIVVEQEDGSLACSPFHIRFGKFSLLRPYEKKVEFRVNGERVDYPMKLGEGGEAFFVFETTNSVPEQLRTSPLVSPVTSPELKPLDVPQLELAPPSALEPEPLELDKGMGRPDSSGSTQRPHSKSTSEGIPIPMDKRKAQSDVGRLSPLAHVPVGDPIKRPLSAADFSEVKSRLRGTLERTTMDSALPAAKAAISASYGSSQPFSNTVHRPRSPLRARTDRSTSPPSITNEEARNRAMNLSKKLWTSNINNQVTESGDLMLDMTGFKSSDGEALHAEVIARQLLSEEIDGPYDIGALIGADEKGNVWIYSSEEAKEAAARKAANTLGAYTPGGIYSSSDAISDPGYHSDDTRSESNVSLTTTHIRRDSDSALGMNSGPSSPDTSPTSGDPNKNYAKTLRLTSDQLKTMDLKPGANSMAFTVNRATCHATLWSWHHSVPIVISDIDGTITKSDVLGHVLNSIGRDWTHQGVAKLYTEISANGYNFMYLTSRSVGQADTTRAYLKGVVQDGGYKLPGGPVILSPDRTIAALRREVYLRKPEIFKMACLRDVMALFTGHGGATNVHESQEAGLYVPIAFTTPGPIPTTPSSTSAPSPHPHHHHHRKPPPSPFYAGFGNRLTDALSYRSVNIPSTRIFTINSNSEVSLDLLSLNTYKTAYGGMREIVDHYFPHVGLGVRGGGEEFTDFNFWRERPLGVEELGGSESESEGDDALEAVLPRGQKTVVAGGLERTDTVVTGRSVLSEDEGEVGEEGLGESYLSEGARGSLEGSLRESLMGEEEGDEMTEPMLREEAEEDGDDEFDGDDGAETDDDEEGVIGAGPVTPDLSEIRRLGYEEGDAESTPRAAVRSVGLGLGLSGV
ncbi:lipin Ned1 [Friedmanniomyces endolithicus]|uniref:Lipin Ned1 n=1 Tax=Friedmanniomyces endolithicus TaxID=329885 RepID=A0AAN6KFY5_9PEZI|nr:lipin Ned1 [Friedmanniomyces endolithicus]KAK0964594.1 lipin Ned1 [Friedmanniomyces endolithicus]KAK0980445.1 lipin Ned1 [Friedmanniomyces endolithicus]KAK1041633.1 lipin Ned1 [Friedmanniomyces endolithicus]